MFFESWSEIGRVVAVGLASYVLLVGILRSAGKRTLAQLNAFDFVVTVALGSILATALLSADVSFTEAATAMALLIGAQFLVTWASVRSARVRKAVRSSPTVLVRDGRVLADQMTASRVSEDEVRQAIRSSGSGGMDLIAAVVLETDGTLSVITRSSLGSGDALPRRQQGG